MATGSNIINAPQAFLLHGFLGVGKTTIAKKLEVEQQAVRFTHDEWMVRLYGIDPPENDFGDLRHRVFEVMEPIWTRCLMVGSNIILDFGFWDFAERTRIRELVIANGGVPMLYSLACTDEDAHQRILLRNKHSQADLYISPSTYDMLKNQFEPLMPTEERIEIWTS